MKIFRKNIYVVVASLMLAAIPHPVLAAAAKGEAKTEGLPQFDLTSFPSQIFWLFVAFVILYVYFSKKALPDVSSILDRRREYINAELNTAETKRKEAEKLQSQYDESVKSALFQSKEINQKAKNTAQDQVERSTLDFQKRSEKSIAATTTEIEKSKAETLQEINGIAADITIQAVEKIAGLKVTKQEALTIINQKNTLEAKAA